MHTGILQEWFGFYWWTSRPFAILVVVLLIILPLVLFRRVGESNLHLQCELAIIPQSCISVVIYLSVKES